MDLERQLTAVFCPVRRGGYASNVSFCKYSWIVAFVGGVAALVRATKNCASKTRAAVDRAFVQEGDLAMVAR